MSYRRWLEKCIDLANLFRNGLSLFSELLNEIQGLDRCEGRYSFRPSLFGFASVLSLGPLHNDESFSFETVFQ